MSFLCCFVPSCFGSSRSGYESVDGNSSDDQQSLRSVYRFQNSQQNSLPLNPDQLMEFISDPENNLYIGFGNGGNNHFSTNTFVLDSDYGNIKIFTISANVGNTTESLIFENTVGNKYKITYTFKDLYSNQSSNFTTTLPQTYDGGRICLEINPPINAYGALRKRLVLSYTDQC